MKTPNHELHILLPFIPLKKKKKKWGIGRKTGKLIETEEKEAKLDRKGQTNRK